MAKTNKKYDDDKQFVSARFLAGMCGLFGSRVADRLRNTDMKEIAKAMMNTCRGFHLTANWPTCSALISRCTVGAGGGNYQMELTCKRCGHRWNYQGKKLPTSAFPQYVSCPRCRTVVRLEFDALGDESGSPKPLPFRRPPIQTPTSAR